MTKRPKLMEMYFALGDYQNAHHTLETLNCDKSFRKAHPYFAEECANVAHRMGGLLNNIDYLVVDVGRNAMGRKGNGDES